MAVVAAGMGGAPGERGDQNERPGLARLVCVPQRGGVVAGCGGVGAGPGHHAEQVARERDQLVVTELVGGGELAGGGLAGPGGSPRATDAEASTRPSRARPRVSCELLRGDGPGPQLGQAAVEEPSRSRGTVISTGPVSVITVLAR